MSTFLRIQTIFQETLKEFLGSNPMVFLRSESFGVEAYARALREIYFYTRESPQLQAQLAARVTGPRRAAVRRLLGHALDEVGHERLALADLQALGVDVEGIPYENPLPSTVPMFAFPAYLLNHGNPVGYLGQILFLEFLPTAVGEELIGALLEVGIPREALEFLAEHSKVDVAHNRLMERHIEDLVLDEYDFDAVAYAIRVCGHHYAAMLEGAFHSTRSPAELGQTVTDGRQAHGAAAGPATQREATVALA